MEGIRLNKYLSDMGICSRREADRLIQAGKVLVDGELAVMGMKVRRDQTVVCDGKTVGAQWGQGEAAGRGGTGSAAQNRAPQNSASRSSAIQGDGWPARVLLAVNKPRGVVCTTSKKDRARNIVEMVNYPERVYPVGRLDKESEGLIFLTNQGELVNQMLKGANGHEKEYVVRVDRPVTKDFIKKMGAGVYLEELGMTTRPCKVRVTGAREFHIILTQGLNRQIRRMCETFGYHVRRLRRIRIMNVELGDLKVGTWRQVTAEEYRTLTDMLERNAAGAGTQAAKGEIQTAGAGRRTAEPGRRGRRAEDGRRSREGAVRGRKTDSGAGKAGTVSQEE